MNEKLKPCPYCGNTEVYIDSVRGLFFVNCPRYSCNRYLIDLYPTAADAAIQWNKIRTKETLKEFFKRFERIRRRYANVYKKA
ncbi:MAG: hypothetical protein J5647_05655 [Spirochaetaceae bacterium]|nr:hypothetical protein [Spirochaetaceae bacterium]